MSDDPTPNEQTWVESAEFPGVCEHCKAPRGHHADNVRCPPMCFVMQTGTTLLCAQPVPCQSHPPRPVPPAPSSDTPSDERTGRQACVRCGSTDEDAVFCQGCHKATDPQPPSLPAPSSSPVGDRVLADLRERIARQVAEWEQTAATQQPPRRHSTIGKVSAGLLIAGWIDAALAAADRGERT